MGTGGTEHWWGGRRPEGIARKREAHPEVRLGRAAAPGVWVMALGRRGPLLGFEVGGSAPPGPRWRGPLAQGAPPRGPIAPPPEPRGEREALGAIGEPAGPAKAWARLLRGVPGRLGGVSGLFRLEPGPSLLERVCHPLPRRAHGPSFLDAGLGDLFPLRARALLQQRMIARHPHCLGLHEHGGIAPSRGPRHVGERGVVLRTVIAITLARGRQRLPLSGPLHPPPWRKPLHPSQRPADRDPMALLGRAIDQPAQIGCRPGAPLLRVGGDQRGDLLLDATGTSAHKRFSGTEREDNTYHTVRAPRACGGAKLSPRRQKAA